MITIKEKNYLSVKEFAAAAKISDKAVYQQLKTRLKEYSESVDGINYICESAIDRFYSDSKGGQVKSQVKSSQVESSLESSERYKYITYLEQELKEYKEQLQEKDKTIKEMQQQIISLTDKIATISSDSLQQLASITKNIQLLQAAEVKEDLIKNQENETTEEVEVEEKVVQMQQPKKSFWDRMRGK